MRRNHELGGMHRAAEPSGAGRRARSLTAALVISSLAAAAAVVAAAADASASEPSTLDGRSSVDAAASCWEIKQQHPDSDDGVYWLRNATLDRPEEFYCDMTTDGGGWVLIGRGREGWTFRDYGQSTTDRLRSEVEGRDAFSPAALSSTTIDALLDGGAVEDLEDGLRLRRAIDKDGSEWQELRWNFLDLEEWSWAIPGGHRLASFSIDGVTGSGSNTKDSDTRMANEVGSGNRQATDREAWFTFPWSGHGRQAGFSYAGGVDGENDDESYLWEYRTENRAIPFTQLFLRPRITTGVLTPIPDGGLEATTLTPLLDDRPAEIAGGVVGVLKDGDSEPNINAPVLAITSLGDRVYVGGKFSDVRDAATGDLVDQPYLAAFDRSTGAWIDEFRPQLDGTVWDLVVADGRLVVAGQFTNVDGAPSTSAMAALDPETGAVDPTWQASFAVDGTTARPMVTTIDLDGDWIYVGGNFTRIDGPTRQLGVGRLARVASSNGDPESAFRPNVIGVPFDIDASGDRIEVVGNFDGINGDTRTSIGSLRTADGSVIGGLADPVWTTGNQSRRYQLAVLADGDEVWSGGSEHNVFVYGASDFQLEKGYVTANQGGDTQVFARVGDQVAKGSHANAWIYHDSAAWPGLNDYTRADIVNWIGLFDAETHEYERDWVPGLGSAYTSGAWAFHVDADGCMWFGGDLLGGPYINGQRQYLESFSKFCPRDTVAPAVPGAAAADVRSDGGVDVAWSASGDDRPGAVGYEVLRNDRVVSPLLYSSSWTDATGAPGDRYFVRAVDRAGNRSATTAVLVAADNTAPTTPGDLVVEVDVDERVTMTWTASSDAQGVENYLIYVTGTEHTSVPGDQTTVTLSDLPAGPSWLAVRAVDAAGNESRLTPSIRVDLLRVDTQRPSTPRDLVVVGDDVTASVAVSWSASSDNVGVVAYELLRNGVVVSSVAGDVTSARLDLGYGDHYVQVQALDAAGNVSRRTASTLTRLVPPPALDTSNPSTPRDLAATVGADGVSVSVSWSASRDNVGVASYRVTRNGAEVASVPAAGFGFGETVSTVLTTLGPGTHYLQVQAFDTAGNSSWRTPSVTVVI